jgi:HEAT repeat protein
MAKIYVSSTFIDLQEHRAQVERVIRRMGHEDVAMEYYVAEDQRPVDRCLSDVAACDLYIGIFAWRYGWIPTKKNRKKLSITEMEYRQAEKTNKKILLFLLSDEAPWPRKFMDKDTTAIEKLRDEASEGHGGDQFKSADELARKVAEAIHKWEKEHGYIPVATSIPEYNLDAYYQALRQRYQTLALEGLTPPQKEEYLQIHLRSVFVEQNVRESPPPVELPKEVWEKLKREKDVHPEDLPSGVTFDDVRRAREVYFEKPSRPVLDVLTDSRYQHTIILGDPGSGKSTLARYIMLSLIDPSTSLRASSSTSLRAGSTGDEKLRRKFDGYLPLLVELRIYVGLCLEKRCETPLEFFEHLGKTEGWALTKDALHNYLKNDGRAVVIFDGLDEIFDPEQRERATHQIVGFTNDYPKVRIIVTSRVIGYRRKILTDAGFTHFTLQDLNEKQVETFVNRWYDLALSDRPDEAKERKERILKSFKDSPSIRQLAGNPMLLTIMAIIGKHQELPRERWKLYDHAASVLIQHWDVNKHLKDQRVEADFIGEDDKKELLRRLAFKMQGAEGGLAGNYIHRDELQAEFESYLIERYSQTADRAKVIAEMMIQQFRERNFILSLYGANLYGFVHRAFLEYFCASAFVYKFEKTKEVTIEQLKTDIYGKHWEDQSWHEVLRLICGMVDDGWAVGVTEYLQNEVYQPWPNEFGKLLPWNIALAWNCINEIRNVAMTEPVIRKMIENLFILFEHGMFSDLELQKFVHQYIIPNVDDAHLPDFENQKLLELILRSRRIIPVGWSSRSAEDLGKLIGRIANKSDLIKSTIISYVNKHFPLHRIWVWAIAHGWADDTQTLPFLEDIALNSPNYEVRSAAIDALGQYFSKDAQTLSLFQDIAIDIDFKDIRCNAVLALGQYFSENSQTLPLLKDLAVNDSEGYVRSSAVRALGQYFNKYEQTLSLLHGRAINDESENVRSSAVRVLGEYFNEDTQTLPLLRDRAINDSVAEVRLSAIKTLGQCFNKDKQTLSLLHDRAINDEAEDVRSSAVRVLGQYFNKDAQIWSFLRDRAIKDGAESVRSSAIEAIGENFIDDAQSFPLLAGWAKNSQHSDVCSSAVRVLGEYFNENSQTLPLLRDRAMNDSAENVRSSAVRYLTHYYLDDEQTLPLLRDCAANAEFPKPNDKKEKWYKYLREFAINAIAKYWPDHPDTLPLLEDRARNDPTPWLRERAKELLKELTEKKKKKNDKKFTQPT